MFSGPSPLRWTWVRALAYLVLQTRCVQSEFVVAPGSGGGGELISKGVVRSGQTLLIAILAVVMIPVTASSQDMGGGMGGGGREGPCAA